MQKKTYLFMALGVIMLGTGFITLRSSDPVQQKPVCKMSQKACPGKKKSSNDPGGLIWEPFSRQFFSVLSFTR